MTKLYKKDNYTKRRSIKIEDKLYEKLNYITKQRYSASISEVINVCIEELLEKEKIEIYEKSRGDLMFYRSIMIRKENEEKLKEAKEKTGISMTRLINIAMKEFIEKHEKIS